MGRRHRLRSHGRGRLGRQDVLLTQGTVRFLGQTGKRFGVVGALAAWRDERSWVWTSGEITRPDIQKQEAQSYECDQCKLVEKQVRHHGNAPSQRCEIEAFYLAFGASNYPQRSGTRPHEKPMADMTPYPLPAGSRL